MGERRWTIWNTRCETPNGTPPTPRTGYHALTPNHTLGRGFWREPPSNPEKNTEPPRGMNLRAHNLVLTCLPSVAVLPMPWPHQRASHQLHPPVERFGAILWHCDRHPSLAVSPRLLSGGKREGISTERGSSPPRPCLRPDVPP